MLSLLGYFDNSFDTIAGYGSNGAIVHYTAQAYNFVWYLVTVFRVRIGRVCRDCRSGSQRQLWNTAELRLCSSRMRSGLDAAS